MYLQKAWMFVSVTRHVACTDLPPANSRKELIESAMKKYNKTEAGVRAWAKNQEDPTEPMLVQFVGIPKNSVHMPVKKRKGKLPKLPTREMGRFRVNS